MVAVQKYISPNSIYDLRFFQTDSCLFDKIIKNGLTIYWFGSWGHEPWRKSDELWFFHLGETLEIISIQNNKLITILLGNDIENGEVLQTMIPANTWFAAKNKNGSGFSLVSCTVAPGFDFADFDLAIRKELVQQFPLLKNVIENFTRE